MPKGNTTLAVETDKNGRIQSFSVDTGESKTEYKKNEDGYEVSSTAVIGTQEGSRTELLTMLKSYMNKKDDLGSISLTTNDNDQKVTKQFNGGEIDKGVEQLQNVVELNSHPTNKIQQAVTKKPIEIEAGISFANASVTTDGTDHHAKDTGKLIPSSMPFDIDLSQVKYKN